MQTTLSNKAAPSGNVPKLRRNPYALAPQTKCRLCADPIPYKRQQLAKTTCLPCQQDLDRTEPVKHTIAIPYNKGAYQYIHNPADLLGTNPKRTT